MKSIAILMAALLLLPFGTSRAQIKDATTESVKIYGNCGMCKSTIEKAGNTKKVAEVNWNKDTKMATLTYNPTKTNREEILKRIALAGYDSDSFLAPDNAYANLPKCCQYERVSQPKSITEIQHAHQYASNNENAAAEQQTHPLKAVFENYFALKDALVASDEAQAANHAQSLVAAINSMPMDKLSSTEHTAWMTVLKDLKSDVEHIEATKDIGHQRDYFITLSEKIYQLMKVAQTKTPVYYQHCPMANNGKGAYWLSKENAVKNPYYGSKMLTCGKTVETIK